MGVHPVLQKRTTPTCLRTASSRIADGNSVRREVSTHQNRSNWLRSRAAFEGLRTCGRTKIPALFSPRFVALVMMAVSRSVHVKTWSHTGSLAYLLEISRRQMCRFRNEPGRTSGRSQPMLAAFMMLWGAGTAFAQPLSVKEFGQLALRCGPNVAPVTLASIARTESGFDPFLIHDNDTKKVLRLPDDRQAAEVASALIASGHSVDLGLMQINSHNLPRLGLQVHDIFDPCVSISAASIILSDAYVGGQTHEEQQKALRVMISRYNTGDAQRGFANGYVSKVEANVRKVVPALDVGLASPGVSPSPLPQSIPAATDPNAPPVWDVWGSYEYSSSPDARKNADQPCASDDGLFVQATNNSGVFLQLRED